MAFTPLKISSSQPNLIKTWKPKEVNQPQIIATGATKQPTNTINLLPQQDFLNAQRQKKPIEYTLNNPNERDYVMSLQPVLPQYTNDNALSKFSRGFMAGATDSFGSLASTVTDLSAWTADKVGLDGLAEFARRTADNIDANTAKDVTFWDNPAQKNPENYDSFIERLPSAVGSGAGNLAIDIPTFKFGKWGKGLVASKNYNMAYTDIRDQLKEDGKYDNMDELKARAAAAGITALDFVGLSKILDTNNITRPIRNTLIGTGTEGLTEGAQEVIQNVTTGSPTWQNVPEAATAGAILGGSVSGVTSTAAFNNEDARASYELEQALKSKIQEKVDNGDVSPLTAQEKRRAAIETGVITPEAAEIMFPDYQDSEVGVIADQLQQMLGFTPDYATDQLQTRISQLREELALELMSNPVTGKIAGGNLMKFRKGLEQSLQKRIDSLKNTFQVAASEQYKGQQAENVIQQEYDTVIKQYEKALNSLMQAETANDLQAAIKESRYAQQLFENTRTKGQSPNFDSTQNILFQKMADGRTNPETRNKMAQLANLLSRSQEVSNENISNEIIFQERTGDLMEGRSIQQALKSRNERKRAVSKARRDVERLQRKLQTAKNKGVRNQTLKRIQKLTDQISDLEKTIAEFDKNYDALIRLRQTAPMLTDTDIENFLYGNDTNTSTTERADKNASKSSPFARMMRSYNQTNEKRMVGEYVKDKINDFISSLITQDARGVFRNEDGTPKVGRTSAYNAAKMIQLVFGTAGKSKAEQTAMSKNREQKTMSIRAFTDLGNLLGKMSTPTKHRIDAFMNTERADAESIQQAEDILNSMTPEERVVTEFVQEAFNFIHDENVKLGLVTQAADTKNRGQYYYRQYINEYAKANWLDELFSENDDAYKNKSIKTMATEQLKKRKNTGSEPDRIKDPGLLLQKALTELYTNKVTAEVIQNLYATEPDAFVDNTSYKGYSNIKLPESEKTQGVFGPAAGKYLRKDYMDDLIGFRAQSDLFNSIYQIATAFDNLALRRAQKSLLTVFNPGVWAGNIMFNYPLAYMAAGALNMPSYIKNYNKYLAYNLAHDKFQRLPEYREAQNLGVAFGENTVGRFNTDEALQAYQLEHGIQEEDLDFKINQSKGKLKGINSKLQNSIEWAGKFYGGVDDAAKLALYKTYTDNGVSPERAADLVNQSMQNYSSVGLIWQLGAKMPVFGKPFVRFTADLTTRILPNVVLAHPLRAFTLFGGIYAASLLSSIMSGEDDEDREKRGESKTEYAINSIKEDIPLVNNGMDKGRNPNYDERTNRFGARKLYGVLPTNIMVGNTELDYSRWTGLYFVNTSESAAGSAVGQLSPIDLGANEPFFGVPAKHILAGATGSDFFKDYKGDPIANPNEMTDEQLAELYGDPERAKRDFATGAYLEATTPPLIKDILRIGGKKFDRDEPSLQNTRVPIVESGTKNQPGDWLRLIALRVDKPAEERQKRVETTSYFDAKNWVRENGSQSKAAWASYDAMKQSTKNDKTVYQQLNQERTQKEILSDWTSRLEHPEWWQIDKEINQKLRETTGQEIDPIYDLNKDQYDAYVNYRIQQEQGGTATGDFISKQNPWMSDFFEKRTNYYNKLKEEGKFEDSEQLAKEVERPEYDDKTNRLVEQFFDRNWENEYGTDAGKMKAIFIRQHPELQKYFDTQATYQANKRKALGLPLYAERPRPSEVVQAKLDYVNTLPYGTGARSKFYKANQDVVEYLIANELYKSAGPFGDGTWANGTSDADMNKLLQQIMEDFSWATGSGSGYGSGYGGSGSYVNVPGGGKIYLSNQGGNSANSLATFGKVVKVKKK